MNSYIRYIMTFSTMLIAVSPAIAACPKDSAEESFVKSWLPNTPEPEFNLSPPAHPAPDCPFYLDAWHNFLFDTKPDSAGRPAFLSFPTIDSIFKNEINTANVLKLAPRSLEFPNDAAMLSVSLQITRIAGGKASLSGGVQQAGNAAILFDQLGYPIYYGIHVNDGYANFLRTNGIKDKLSIENADSGLKFPEGVVELKSSWRVLTDPALENLYITTMAEVPRLHVVNNRIEADRALPPRKVHLGLVALHVVFTLKDHPEFIWSTFEHADLTGETDLGPSSAVNPDANGSGPSTPISPFSYLLYHGGDLGTVANLAPTFSQQAAAFNEITQRLDKGGALPTSVYRAYPAAKSTAIDLDDDVVDANAFMLAQFQAGVLPTSDKRRYYRLVGATWLDRPDLTFLLNKPFQNEDGQSSDDGIVAGEDALSSLAMESFTQIDSPNCFSCHDTRPVTKVGGGIILKEKLLNVSHALSKFVEDH